MKRFKQFCEEAVATNCAGAGHIAGIGIGPQGEPGKRRKRRRGNDSKSPILARSPR